MFKKVLIANRGEIALRVIRTLREMGIRSVAVYSEADRDSLHATAADEAVCIGPAPAKESYLYVPNLISAAEITECDAVHPGYGFLAENGMFASVCAEHGLAFVGPTRAAMEALGDKSRARKNMSAAGIPIVPGSLPLADEAQAVAAAAAIGCPVIIKASGGGGGRGMRIVRAPEEVVPAYRQARREAGAAFNNDEVYLEKYVTRARHIEVQVIADAHGHVVHLGERDCSTQRRHQKLVEESPAPGLRPAQRAELCRIACEAARASGYTNAGTVEFIYDCEADAFYFMEMNARIQVEHPVSEMVTGIDLVREQFRVAAGEPLSFTQEQVAFRGHAIECRINAEDPARDFAPSGGRVAAYVPPGGPGVRMDSHLFAGYEIPPYYDSLIGKLIVWAEDREWAIQRMRRALADLRIDGIPTTIPFQHRILGSEGFGTARLHTGLVEEILKGR